MTALALVAARSSRLEEFAREPMLTVACVVLVVVSLAWIVVSRAIYRNLKKAAAAAPPPRRRRPRSRPPAGSS
jgi:cell division protein FtsX